MADIERVDPGVPVSHLPSHEKAKRSGSFGHVASDYERYRPGPPAAAVDWILSSGRRKRIVDLGAGTGALSRLLVERADEVIAIEPDDRMRAVLVEEVPLARAVAGRGESMPLPDGHVEAIIAAARGTGWTRSRLSRKPVASRTGRGPGGHMDRARPGGSLS